MLRSDSWWNAISDVDPDQKKVLEKLARLPRSSYRFYLDERQAGPQALVEVFLDIVVPEIRKLAREVTSRAASSAKQFTKDRGTVEECLLAGVVPHSRNAAPLNPTFIINAAFLILFDLIAGPY